ncbi:MAG: LysM peptidoglycan-binding domain-containing protein [Chloroflexi bacterium]|nr:LysM peptidoglycan-binding domain-containing protein [Chloroflexota bacterium]
MQISHAEAHTLIQQSFDDSLPREEENALTVHLQTCPECSSYRDELRDVEYTLRSTMNKHWGLTPVLSMDVVTGKVNSHGRLGLQLATISLTVMLVVVSAWRLINSNITPANLTPPQVSPIPTPSTQMTSTRALASNCEEIAYTVREGDTLAGIAAMFSTSVETIADWNNLQSDLLKAGSEITVPVCFTPSATAHPATFTVTFSPAPLTASSP